MDLHLKDKTALVTGGSRGLGEAICLGPAAEGARVAVFLASERASYMTGATVNVSGGLLMG